MTVKLLTKHHLEFLSLKGGYTCSSESTLVLSKYHIVGNLMLRLNYLISTKTHVLVNILFFLNFVKKLSKKDKMSCVSFYMPYLNRVNILAFYFFSLSLSNSNLQTLRTCPKLEMQKSTIIFHAKNE